MAQFSKMNRRGFMRCGATAMAGGALAAGSPSLARGAHGKRPPNVVFLICDQMRGDALGCLGNPNARTPNLDRLAANGVLFERWFSNNPVCAPSRVSLFSGLYPHQHGKMTNDAGEYLDSFNGNLLGHFRARGYRTGWVGKNHTFDKRVLHRLDSCSLRTREPFRRYSEQVPPWWHGGMEWPEEKCYATVNTREGVEFIRASKKDEPYFLHVSYFDPHPPYFVPEAAVAPYRDRDMRLPPHVPATDLSSRLDEYRRAMHFDRLSDAELRETMRHYHASVEWGVDRQVGEILKALEETGQMENTIIVFTSDHGDFMGQHGMVRKGPFHYDALLHVPMIWWAPGRIAAGLRVPGLAQGVDLFPTLAVLSGGTAPEGLPGRSLVPQLCGESDAGDDATVYACTAYEDLPKDYFEHPEAFEKPDAREPVHTRVMKRASKATSRSVMARNEEWKLILNETQPPELYRMAGGTVESENVAEEAAHREVRQALEDKARRLWAW